MKCQEWWNGMDWNAEAMEYYRHIHTRYTPSFVVSRLMPMVNQRATVIYQILYVFEVLSLWCCKSVVGICNMHGLYCILSVPDFGIGIIYLMP